jgi:hypothetical protein
MLIGSLLLTIATLRTPPPPHTHRLYGFASFAFAEHPHSEIYYRDYSQPVGGHGWDISGGGGVFILRRLAVEGELVSGGTVATSEGGYFNEQARDVLLNALARYSLGSPGNPPRLQLVAGGGVAWTHMWDDQGMRPNVWLNGQKTLTLGADVTVVERSHACLAGSFRWRWVDRDLVYGNGYGTSTYQFGATLFVR